MSVNEYSATLTEIRARRALITGEAWDYSIQEMPTEKGPTRKPLITWNDGPVDHIVGVFALAYDAVFAAHAPQDIDWLIAALAFETEQRDMRHAAWLEEADRRQELEREIATLKAGRDERRVNATCDHDWEDIIIDPDFRIDVCMRCGLERSTDLKNNKVKFTPGIPDPSTRLPPAGRRAMRYPAPSDVGTFSVYIYSEGDDDDR